MSIPDQYNVGYNLGVGGAVVRGRELLMVRRSSRYDGGIWQLPGGYVEPDETIESAVVREVREEAGVDTRVLGIVGVRNRYVPRVGNSTYVVLLLAPLSGEPTPDFVEVDRAGYFTMKRIEELVPLPLINREIALSVLSRRPNPLTPRKMIHRDGDTYILFAS